MSHIARFNATLSMKKRAVLQRRKVSSNTFKSFPLSHAQQRLWLLDQFEPGNPNYNISTSWHLHGPLDVRVLEQSLNRIVQRHEVWRATFATMQEQPVGGICFRSPHLARGYLGDDTLTRECFISNPFTRASNDRIY